MRWLLLGALLAVLLLYPAVLTVAGTIAAAILAKPVMVAFGLGLAVRLQLPQLRRWRR